MSNKLEKIQLQIIEAPKAAKVVLSETACTFKDKIPSLTTIQQTYEAVKRVGKAKPWHIGDCIVAGEDYHGEKSSQMLDPDEVAHETESNYANVCRAFIESRRRGKPLSFSHHAVVYKLTPEDQDKLLDLAIENNWSEKDLRKEAAKLRAKTTAVRAHQRQLPNTEGERLFIRIEFTEANKSQVHEAVNAMKAQGVIEDWDSCA